MNVKIWIKEDFASFTAVTDHRGRITIPASVRRHLSIRFGSAIEADIYKLKREIKR